MTIKSIQKSEGRKFIINLVPNWLEKIFGIKPKQVILKDTNCEYTFGGGTAYVDSKGNQTGYGSKYGKAIDKFRRKENF